MASINVLMPPSSSQLTTYGLDLFLSAAAQFCTSVIVSHWRTPIDCEPIMYYLLDSGQAPSKVRKSNENCNFFGGWKSFNVLIHVSPHVHMAGPTESGLSGGLRLHQGNTGGGKIPTMPFCKKPIPSLTCKHLVVLSSLQ